MIPMNDAGTAYRRALSDLEKAVTTESQAAHVLANAVRDVGVKREQVHTAVIKLMGERVREVVGPDGGK